jgi:hypothetical protein
MKKLLFRLVATATVALLPSGAFAQSSPSLAPTGFPKMFVGKPEFHTTAGNRSPGTACLVKFEDSAQIYLLTVRHLLGPSGGFPQLIPPDQVPAFVSEIRLWHFFAPGSKLYRVNGIAVPETPDHKSPLFNVAIFKTNDAFPTHVATITTEKPSLGETVWVVARVRASRDDYFHSAKVIDNGDRWLRGEFDEAEIVPNGASGAPVLNRAGKIVGIYCTHTNKEGKVFAYAIPSALFAQVIAGKSGPR